MDSSPEAPLRSTIDDVARLANVSIATVSRFTSGQNSLISPATQQRLRQAIEQLSYVPNSAARTLKTGRSRLIGVILAEVSHVYWSAMLSGIEAGSREMGYGVLISSAQNNPDTQRSYLQTFIQHGVDGILLNPAANVNQSLAAWSRVRVPIIQLDRGLTGLDFPVVAVDNAKGASLAVQHLMEAGHRKIGIVSWEINGLSNRRERLDGFLSTMQDAAIVVPERYLAIVDEQSDGGVRGVQRLMDQTDPPTAIFSTNMELSLQVLTGLRQSGLRVPDDVSLVGFDDPEWAPLIDPPLTTIATPPFRLGKLAALRLCRAIERAPASSSRHSRLEPVLISRQSVAPPNGRKAPRHIGIEQRGPVEGMSR